MSTSNQHALLALRDLQVTFHTKAATIPAVENVSLSLDPGEVLALVGESGCGKSVTALSILRLLPSPPTCTINGTIHFNGREISRLPEQAMRNLRGREVGMVFQDPWRAFNPVYRIGDHLLESLHHLHLDAPRARERALALLSSVGFPSSAERLDAYPHELSGGLRQRVAIAMALACEPALLIADEATTALDLTVQAQILATLRQLQRVQKMALLLITHDLGVVATSADRVAVLYAGRVVELAAVGQVLSGAAHPYTQGLLRCIPRPERPRGELQAIPGTVPPPHLRPPGCAFHPRCPFADDTCQRQRPPLRDLSAAHQVACHHAGLRVPPLDILAEPRDP